MQRVSGPVTRAGRKEKLYIDKKLKRGWGDGGRCQTESGKRPVE